MKNTTSLGIECEEDCDGINNYSDGIFHYCMCRARRMNTFVNANVIHDRTGKRPVKEITITYGGEEDGN